MNIREYLSPELSTLNGFLKHRINYSI